MNDAGAPGAESPAAAEPATGSGSGGAGQNRAVRKRAADFVRGRSSTQKVGAVGAIMLLVSAPFGGLDEVRPAPAALTQGSTYDIGPIEVSITSVTSVSTLAPALEPQPGHRLLVIRMDVQNISDQPLYGTQVTSAMGGSGLGAVPFRGATKPEPVLLNVEDGGPISEINPGVEFDTALVLEQEGDWEPREVRLSLTKFYFQVEDPTGADPERWRLGTDRLVGDFQVRMRP